jgi:hypothetical protein
MANAKDAYRAVAAVLEGNPGNQTLEAIIEGTEVLEDTTITEAQATRARGRLVKEGRVALTEDGDEPRWRASGSVEEEAVAETDDEDPQETSEAAPEETEPYFTVWRRQYAGAAECVVRPASTQEVARSRSSNSLASITRSRSRATHSPPSTCCARSPSGSGPSSSASSARVLASSHGGRACPPP